MTRRSTSVVFRMLGVIPGLSFIVQPAAFPCLGRHLPGGAFRAALLMVTRICTRLERPFQVVLHDAPGVFSLCPGYHVDTLRGK